MLVAVFYDDFERANGGLGTNWTDAYSTSAIAGGYAVGGTDSYAVNNVVTDTDYQEVIVEAGWLTGQGRSGMPLIKAATTGRSGYFCGWSYSAPNWYFTLWKRGASGETQLATDLYGTSVPFLSTMRLIWDHGAISATVNGGHLLTSDDSQYALNTGMGIKLTNSNTPVASFRAFGTATAGLSVSPELIGNYGSCSTVTLTGTGTAWTPGTPGSPTFTVDHGTISAQTVDSATSATLTYCPGDYLGTVTFTDPSTGSTAGALVTSDPNLVPPDGQAWPNAGWKLVTNAAGNAHPTSLAITEATLIHATQAPELNIDIVQAIAEIWAGMYHFRAVSGVDTIADYLSAIMIALMGDNSPMVQLYTAERGTSIREEVEGITDRLETLITPTQYTLENVIASVKGLDNRSVTQVYDLINALTLGNNDDVLLWLNTYLGTTGPTLEQLGTMVSDLATIAGYTLGDVLDAIAAIPGADLTPVLTKLGKIQPSEAADLTTITNQLTQIDVNVDAIVASLEALRTGSNYTIQDILDAIEAITPGEPGVSGSSLPLWPGLAGVTLGTEVPLADDLTLAGPLHGLLFTITGQPEHNQKYMFGTVASWARVGQVLFKTDRGDYERSQTFGIDRQVLTPLTMEVADAAIIRLNPNWSGTVRPWTRT